MSSRNAGFGNMGQGNGTPRSSPASTIPSQPSSKSTLSRAANSACHLPIRPFDRVHVERPEWRLDVSHSSMPGKVGVVASTQIGVSPEPNRSDPVLSTRSHGGGDGWDTPTMAAHWPIHHLLARLAFASGGGLLDEYQALFTEAELIVDDPRIAVSGLRGCPGDRREARQAKTSGPGGNTRHVIGTTTAYPAWSASASIAIACGATRRVAHFFPRDQAPPGADARSTPGQERQAGVGNDTVALPGASGCPS